MDRKKINGWARWLHAYLSMFSFTALLFFACTGITLNHPSWTDGIQKTEIIKGSFDTLLLAGNDTSVVGRSEITGFFRDSHKIKARLTEFRTSAMDCSLSFTGPGYSAYAIIDRSDGSYELMVTKAGFIAAMNDLHKGTETGKRWPLIVDIIALMMIIISLTGFIMIFFITRKKIKYLLFSILGTVVFVLLILLSAGV
jgi:hypothetical protein